MGNQMGEQVEKLQRFKKLGSQKDKLDEKTYHRALKSNGTIGNEDFGRMKRVMEGMMREKGLKKHK